MPPSPRIRTAAAPRWPRATLPAGDYTWAARPPAPVPPAAATDLWTGGTGTFSVKTSGTPPVTVTSSGTLTPPTVLGAGDGAGRRQRRRRPDGDAAATCWGDRGGRADQQLPVRRRSACRRRPTGASRCGIRPPRTSSFRIRPASLSPDTDPTAAGPGCVRGLHVHSHGPARRPADGQPGTRHGSRRRAGADSRRNDRLDRISDDCRQRDVGRRAATHPRRRELHA